jgi:hypothetical protein
MFMRMQILDLAQKYSVGLQEVFVCLQVVLPGRKFFFPTLFGLRMGNVHY